MHETLSLQTEPAPHLLRRVAMMVDDMRELACDHLELAALEARRAGSELVRMLCAAVAISILVTTAWLALVAGGIVWATAAGMSWSVALLIAAALNIVIGALLAWWIRANVREPLFAASLRQLRRDAAAMEDAPLSAAPGDRTAADAANVGAL
jgi:uncharacterized membrane protein YqjE